MKNLIFLDTVIKMPLMDLPVRSVCVQLKKGHILISPGSKMSSEHYKSISGITDIVAPNLLHCSGVDKAATVFTSAQRWGPMGAIEAKSEIKWDKILSQESWLYQDELEMIFIDGVPKLNEVAFFHKESKSLIVADLCFNLAHARGIGAWIILKMFGTYRKFGISKFFLRLVKDKQRFQSSCRQLLDLDFENIIVSHGENIIGNAKPILLAAIQERGL